MASNYSLQYYSCMAPVLLGANPQQRITLSPSPHPLLRSRRYVSCSGGDGDQEKEKPSASPAGRVDRRNMLLGLGGMSYGAATLFSDPKPAVADPIKAPNLTLCGKAYDFSSGDLLDGNFCPPPYSGSVKDYVIPKNTKVRVRKPAHLLEQKEKEKFAKAILKMKLLDISDPRGFQQQANIHAAYCNSAYPQVGSMGTPISVHYSWIFYPFHRWYLYFFERILVKLLQEDGEDVSNFALPFWNYDNDDGGMLFPEIYNQKNGFPALYDENRNPDNVSGKIIDLSYNSGITDEKELKDYNVGVMYNEMIGRVDSTEAFMGQPYRAGEIMPGPTRAGTGEAGSHISVHRWVGHPKNKYKEDLGNFYSAGRDPAFYGLHANVDRLWTIWQGLQNGVPKSFDDPDYLNASFLFYDENKELVKVKVRDCLDNTKLGYDYEHVRMPWKFYRAGGDLKKITVKEMNPAGVEKRDPKKVFPNYTLRYITRVFVPRSTAGAKDDEVLVLENISSDRTKFVKFDVYVSEEGAEKSEQVVYAGTYAHLPHFHKHIDSRESMIHETNKLPISLKLLYKNINIDDKKDKVVVTLIPRSDDVATIANMYIFSKQQAPNNNIAEEIPDETKVKGNDSVQQPPPVEPAKVTYLSNGVEEPETVNTTGAESKAMEGKDN